ncbi:MAG: hypothetical protein R3F29_10330 [Planctomycetota bacterium]
MYRRVPPFSAQRLMLLAMVFGITMYAIAAGVVIHFNDGKGLVDRMDRTLVDLTTWIGGGAALAALAARQLLQRSVAGLSGDEARMRHFQTRVVPIVILEGGALFALTIWMLSGKDVPPLAVAMVLLAIAIANVPFRDPAERA